MVRLLVVALATLGLASPHLMIFHVETDGLNLTEPFPSVCRIWFTKWQKHQSCGWASLQPHRLRLDVCKWRSKMLTFASNLEVKPERCWTLGHRKETRISKCNSLPEGKEEPHLTSAVPLCAGNHGYHPSCLWGKETHFAPFGLQVGIVLSYGFCCLF